MLVHATERFLRSTVAQASLASQKDFRRGEQRPSPAIFPIVFVARIYKVLGDDVTPHLQTSNVRVETTAHLRTCESTFGTQLTGDEALMLTESLQYHVLDGALLGYGHATAAIIYQVGPPGTADEASLLCEELAIDTGTLRNDWAFPLP